MDRTARARSDAARRVRELVFAVLAVWLVVQNLMLLSLLSWSTVSSAWVVAGALFNVARVVLSHGGIVPVIGLLGVAVVAVVAALMRAAEKPFETLRVEVRHG